MNLRTGSIVHWAERNHAEDPQIAESAVCRKIRVAELITHHGTPFDIERAGFSLRLDGGFVELLRHLLGILEAARRRQRLVKAIRNGKACLRTKRRAPHEA